MTFATAEIHHVMAITSELEDRRFEIEALLPDVRLPLKLPGPAG